MITLHIATVAELKAEREIVQQERAQVLIERSTIAMNEAQVRRNKLEQERLDEWLQEIDAELKSRDND